MVIIIIITIVRTIVIFFTKHLLYSCKLFLFLNYTSMLQLPVARPPSALGRPLSAAERPIVSGRPVTASSRPPSTSGRPGTALLRPPSASQRFNETLPESQVHAI